MLNIKAMIRVSLLDNETQNLIAEEYGLSDASSYVLACTEGGKLFLYKGELQISDPAGGVCDPIKVSDDAAALIKDIFKSLRKEKKEDEDDTCNIG